MGDGVLRFNLGRAALLTLHTHTHIGDVLEKRARERRWEPREGDTVAVKGLGGCG